LFTGYALEGNVTAEHQVVSSFDCAFHCIGDSRCKSFNLKVANVTEKHKCEINNATKLTSNAFAYVRKAGFSYYESEVLKGFSKLEITSTG
jgi:hypothetical protein